MEVCAEEEIVVEVVVVEQVDYPAEEEREELVVVVVAVEGFVVFRVNPYPITSVQNLVSLGMQAMIMWVQVLPVESGVSLQGQ